MEKIYGTIHNLSIITLWLHMITLGVKKALPLSVLTHLSRRIHDRYRHIWAYSSNCTHTYDHVLPFFWQYRCCYCGFIQHDENAQPHGWNNSRPGMYIYVKQFNSACVGLPKQQVYIGIVIEQTGKMIQAYLVSRNLWCLCLSFTCLYVVAWLICHLTCPCFGDEWYWQASVLFDSITISTFTCYAFV